MQKQLPLDGLTVVELGHSVAAPYAGLVLAELGAAVVKLERPGKGDDARSWGPPFTGETSVMFAAYNRHKKSVEVDLKTEAGLATVRALARDCDIFLQNLRPGQAAELGLTGEALQKENPRLIYAAISAFGENGPLASKPGYDPLAQAFGGLMSVTGEEGRPGVRVGPSIIDMGSGMWLVMGILAALHTRHLTGRGTIVGTSLYETALGWMNYYVPQYTATGTLPRKQGSGTTALVPYQLFATTDGEMVIAAGNDNLFRKLATSLGRPEWVEDPRFRTNPDRVRHRTELCDAIAALIKQRPTAAWVADFERQGIPCAPLHTVDQVIAHPQTQALDILRTGADTAKYVGLPLRFDGARPGRNGPPPRLGDANGKYAG